MASRYIVEWTRTTLRLALADGDGPRARVRSIVSQSLGATDNIAEALHTLLGKHPPTSGQVIGVIPREQVITRVVKFPATRPSELRQMVELYAKAQLPYPREQAVFDFHIISQQEGFSTVAIVASQRELVNRQLTTLREAGFSAIFLTVSSWGVLGWYRQAVAASVAKDQEPVLVVNVDDSRSDLVLIADGHMLSSRSVGQGMRDWEASGDTGELLALEIERSRAALRKELPGTEVHSLIVTGLGPLPQWREELSKRLGNLPVTAVEERQPFKEWTTSLAAPISPVVVGGVACSELRGLLSLSPAELRLQARHRQQVKELVLVSLLLLGVFALGAGLLVTEISRQRRIAVQVDHALAQVEPAAKRVQEQTRSAEVVRAMLDERRRFAMVLSSVFSATPSSIALETVDYERARNELTLRGNAPSTQDVLDYIKRLEELEGVAGAQLKYSTRRSSLSGERTDFELLLEQRHPAS